MGVPPVGPRHPLFTVLGLWGHTAIKGSPSSALVDPQCHWRDTPVSRWRRPEGSGLGRASTQNSGNLLSPGLGVRRGAFLDE